MFLWFQDIKIQIETEWKFFLADKYFFSLLRNNKIWNNEEENLHWYEKTQGKEYYLIYKNKGFKRLFLPYDSICSQYYFIVAYF